MSEKPYWRSWTEAEDEKIRETWREGLSVQIASAALVGRSPKAVRSRALRLGLEDRYNHQPPAAEVDLPTLAHVPGVEITGRYSTRIFRTQQRSKLHGLLKRPRKLFASPMPGPGRIIHLGIGKAWRGGEMDRQPEEVPFQ